MKLEYVALGISRNHKIYFETDYARFGWIRTSTVCKNGLRFEKMKPYVYHKREVLGNG